MKRYTIFKIGDTVRIITRDYDYLCGYANSILTVNDIKLDEFTREVLLELITEKGETIDGGAKVIWINESDVDFHYNIISSTR